MVKENVLNRVEQLGRHFSAEMQHEGVGAREATLTAVIFAAQIAAAFCCMTDEPTGREKCIQELIELFSRTTKTHIRGGLTS